MSLGVANARPLRVCHVITGLGQGGAENALCKLVEGDRFHNQVTVVSLTGRGFHAERLEATGALVVALSISGLSSLVAGLFRLRRIYKETRPDVIQTWMYHADLLGGVVARFMGIPVAWGLRQSNLSGQHVKAGTRIVAKVSALFSGMLPSVIVACARRVAIYHRGLGYKGKMVAIPNGLDLSDYLSDSANVASMRDELGIRGSFVVCHVGRADTQKDHGTLLKAFRLFLAKHPGQPFAVDWSKDSRKNPVISRDFPITRDERQRLGFGIPEGCSNSIAGFGRVWSEFSERRFSQCGGRGHGKWCAMCCHRLWRCSRDGWRHRWTVPVKDAEAMASALSEAAAESQSQRMRRRRLARARAEQMFGIQSMVDAYQRLWLEMVNDVCVE